MIERLLLLLDPSPESIGAPTQARGAAAQAKSAQARATYVSFFQVMSVGETPTSNVGARGNEHPVGSESLARPSAGKDRA
jgi:hypothetical protein